MLLGQIAFCTIFLYILWMVLLNYVYVFFQLMNTIELDFSLYERCNANVPC